MLIGYMDVANQCGSNIYGDTEDKYVSGREENCRLVSIIRWTQVCLIPKLCSFQKIFSACQRQTVAQLKWGGGWTMSPSSIHREQRHTAQKDRVPRRETVFSGPSWNSLCFQNGDGAGKSDCTWGHATVSERSQLRKDNGFYSPEGHLCLPRTALLS